MQSNNEILARTFICLGIPQDAQEYLDTIISGGRKIRERISWSKPGNIHMTLKFLGEILPQQVEKISATLQEVASNNPGFEITVDQLGAFPNFRTPRIFWVGSSHIPEQLAELVADLQEKLQDIGFEKNKRPFKPHLTLGRVKKSTSQRTVDYLKHVDFKPQTISCSEIIFMKSDLHPTGAKYTPLQKFKLQNPNSD